MRFVPRLLLSVLFLAPWASAQETVRFRLWLAGQEAGGTAVERSTGPGWAQVESREWMKLERGAVTIAQEARQRVRRAEDGALAFSWSVKIAQDPLEGAASWVPSRPGVLRIEPRGGPAKELQVPAGALLWPGDLDRRLKDAAKARTAVKATTFNPQAEGWNELDLTCAGPDPLPGWPDAVRFQGRIQEGPIKLEAVLWISPKDGELKQSSQIMGLPVLIQRAELPAPGEAPQAGVFERTLQRLPAHPFAAWLPELTVRWTGKAPLDLPEDGQQRRAGPQRLALQRAAVPSPEEARELPVKGQPAPEDAPFLAVTPLVPFRDPVFDGPLVRLAAPAQASRWELAKKITTFVFEWIQEKDYSVGFASAAEVCRIAKGDCTEHGVLAVALLRRLGVPARGAMGWAALGDTLALHFWVEVRLKDRWVPIDPTFDQAPASAFRIKLGHTDLANLASVGWDSAAEVFGQGRWIPETEGGLPWGKGYYISGDDIGGPGVGHLEFPGAAWTVDRGQLTFAAFGLRTPVETAIRPSPAQVAEATRLRATQATQAGWYRPDTKRLWLDLGGRWLVFDRLRPSEAQKVVEFLQYRSPGR